MLLVSSKHDKHESTGTTSSGHPTHQQEVKGVTTLSPTLTVFTSSPASTITPVNSWPMMKPVAEGWWPLKTCSSLFANQSTLEAPSEEFTNHHSGPGSRIASTYEPHRAVAWTFTMISCACCTTDACVSQNEANCLGLGGGKSLRSYSSASACPERKP